MARSSLSLTTLLPLALMMTLPGMAFAATPSQSFGTWSADVRLRSEQVSQAGLPEDASALTVRTYLGWQSPRAGGWGLFVQGVNTSVLNDSYNNTLNGKTRYPTVVDPDTTDLHQLHVSYAGAAHSLQIGRARKVYDNARFLGDNGFRQQSQTFDGLWGQSKVAQAEVTYGYLTGVNRVFGKDSPQGQWDLATPFVGVKLPLTKALTAHGFILAYDNQDVASQSSLTTALGLSGQWSVDKDTKLTARVDWARQSDHADNPARFDLDFTALDVGFQHQQTQISMLLEKHESNGVQAFQTPLGTRRVTLGWTDAMLTTPAQGLINQKLSVRQGLTVKGLPGSLSAFAAVQQFSPERGQGRYGREVALGLTHKLNAHWSWDVAWADIDSKSASLPSRDKLWVFVTYSR
ncbi:MAG: alginate export family protein [Asticcacaulis sp.]